MSAQWEAYSKDKDSCKDYVHLDFVHSNDNSVEASIVQESILSQTNWDARVQIHIQILAMYYKKTLTGGR